MLEVADVLRRYGPAYLQTFAEAVPARHRRVIQELTACRTAALGGHLYRCNRCGQPQYAYHSCRNRHCPKCHGQQRQDWLAARRRELLAVPYFHVVFTLPSQLRRLVRQHPHVLYGILMQSAAAALIKLAADPHYVGGQIGILAVLHTWTRTLEFHPHVHCLVPGGGLSPEGRWLPARADYLVPVQALSRIFRGMFLQRARQALPQICWPTALRDPDWVVYAKPTVQGPDQVLAYLARYVHRVALSNSRILSIDDGQVSFRYQRVNDARPRIMTLSAQEFIRRFLQHVLPDRVHKVRYYGLWAPANRRRLQQLQQQWGPQDACPSDPPAGHPESPDPDPAGLAGRPCPQCGQGILVWIARIPRLACSGSLPRAP